MASNSLTGRGRSLLTLAIAVACLAAGCQKSDPPTVTGSTSSAPNKTITSKTVAPTAQVDTALAQATIEALAKGSEQEKQSQAEKIKSSSENYAPPVLFVLSRVLFSEGKKDEAAFWYFAGVLRARFDANRCADVSARQAVAILKQTFGPPITEHVFQDKSKLKPLIQRVVAWDRKTPHNYDHRWINLHGMGVMIDSLKGKKTDAGGTSLPEKQWDEIAEKTRAEFLAGLDRAISPTGLGSPKDSFTSPQVAQLAEAVEHGDLPEIDRLVADGVDVNAEGTAESERLTVTPLIWAMRAKNKPAFLRLLEHKADPNRQFKNGTSVTSLAAEEREDSDWLEMALKHGANPSLLNPVGYIGKNTTPIFDAIRSKNMKNIELLIRAGADLDHQTAAGTTPILAAVTDNRYDIVFRLVEAGADYRLHGIRGHDLAYEVISSRFEPGTEGWKERERVIALLEKRGVDFSSAEKRVAAEEPEALERWKRQQQVRAAERKGR